MKTQDDIDPKKDISKDTSTDHMPWVHSRDGRSYRFFQSPPLLINASPEKVWSIVKNVENYGLYSHNQVVAHVDGEPQIDKKIHLDLYKGEALGWLIPHSQERISVVDEKTKTIGWEKTLPGGGVTERYQVLEPTDDGKTRSYIALRIPGSVGFLTANSGLKKPIETAFTSLNQGIKEAAERDEESREIHQSQP